MKWSDTHTHTEIFSPIPRRKIESTRTRIHANSEHNLDRKSLAINFQDGSWKLWKQHCRNAFKFNTNIYVHLSPLSFFSIPSMAILFCVILFLELDTADTVHAYSPKTLSLSLAVPNDLSLTKRFLMHIFYFTSCNYDKLLKTVNGTHLYSHRRVEKANAVAWRNQRNKPPATKSLERIWLK